MTAETEATPAPEAQAGQPIVKKGIVYWVTMACLGPMLRVLCRARVYGREYIPAGGALIASNHQSTLDIPLIAFAAGRRHVAFIARETLSQSSLLAFVMRKSGAILIRRGTGDRAALRAAARHLELGDLVAIFPEGTRSPDGSLREFKKGGLLAAKLADVPVVPCAIQGSGAAMPRGRLLPRSGRITIAFGPPLDPTRPGATEELRCAVAQLLGESLESPAEAGAEDPPFSRSKAPR